MSDEVESNVEPIAVHSVGDLNPQELQAAIAQAWIDLTGTEEGKAEVAAALLVKPLEIHPGAAPVALEEPPSGFDPHHLVIALQWVALNVAVPVLVGLAKDEVKARVLQLWRQVLLPAIRHGRQSVLGDEQT